jgi:hypothetical protein
MDRSRPNPSSPRLPVCGSVQSDLPIRPDWTEPYRSLGLSGLVESLDSTGAISFWATRPNAKPVKVTLQHDLYVPACGTNNLLIVIQLMKKGVRFDFTLEKGALATFGSALVTLAHW